MGKSSLKCFETIDFIELCAIRMFTMGNQPIVGGGISEEFYPETINHT